MSVRSKPNREVEAPAEPERDGSELPEGWSRCKVGGVFSISSGGTPSRNESSFWNGDVPWLSSGDIKTDEIDVGSEFITDAALQNSTAKLCEPGSVIVVVRSGVLKHTLPVALLRRRAAINQDIKCFDSGDSDLNRWLAVALRASSRDILAENREGTTVQSVKSETLRDFELPVPPLAEQRRIVGKLELLLGKVSSSQQRLSRVPGLLKRFRQSVLAAACSGKLTADWREENPKTRAYETDVPTDAGDHDDELPLNWLQTTLGPLIELVTSGSRGWAKYYADSGCLFIRAQNINSDVLRLDDVAFVRLPNKAEGLRTRVQKDDILVTITGANVTKSALVDCDLDDAYVSQHVALVRLTDRRLAPFLFHWIVSTAHGRKQLLESAYGQGKPGLNLDNIRDVAIALPPLSEQQEIVRRVEKLFAFADQIEARLKLAQTHVDRITQSLLAKAFRGELVPTEHALASADGRDYESASELLQRIDAERGTNSTEPKKTKGRRRKSQPQKSNADRE